MALFVDQTGALQNDAEILQSFLDAVKGDIIENSESQDRNASGKAKRNLRVETGTTSGKLIDGAGYTYWGWEHGRAPGRFPPREAIEQWIEARHIIPQGISKSSLTFLIQRKIAQSGTLLFQHGGNSGVISGAVTSERLSALREAFGTKYATVVKTEILKSFQ